MSLFKFLQLQSLEPENANSDLDYFEEDSITLEDTIDGDALANSWSTIVDTTDSES